MKDNYPNYLNLHNIDPAHVSPARIDSNPGNDSIRPVSLVGGDWSKGIQDHAKQIGSFPSESRLRHFVRHGQPPTMSNAEAIEVLKHLEADIYGRIAIVKAIDALMEREAKE